MFPLGLVRMVVLGYPRTACARRPSLTSVVIPCLFICGSTPRGIPEVLHKDVIPLGHVLLVP